MKYLCRYTPALIVAVYVLLFMAFKSPERPWDRIINSDGKGYYAYLPAIFIYHDLQYNFVEQYEYQYYPSNRSVFKEFRNDANGHKVNKYFPGLAIIWLPFFLLGHAFAWLEVFPRDGYSLPYQYAIAFSAFFFLWLGARWLIKLLRATGAGDKQAAFITAIITLGTNLLFFTIIEPTMTHVYSFALVTGFLLACHRLFHEYRPKWFVKALLAFTLIFLIRPTNGVILLLIPFMAGNSETLLSTARKVWEEKKALIRGAVQAIVLLSIPLVLWYLQTGKPLVYTYTNEKLEFFSPNMASILFSFNRGWFIYTPVAFVAMFGFIGLFRESRFRFYWLLAFLLTFTYVVSCWWIWNYASKCGQRVFIDSYAIVALLMLFLFRQIGSAWGRSLLSWLLVLLIALNLVQFWQHARWIFPPSNISAGIYFDSFLSYSKKARVYVPSEGVVAEKSFTNDMETETGAEWMNPRTRTDSLAHEGRWSSKVNRIIPYSVGLESPLDAGFSTTNRIVHVSAWVFDRSSDSKSSLVADFQHNGQSLSYNQFLLKEYARRDEWVPVEAAFYVPNDLPSGAVVKVYFYNPSQQHELFVDEITVKFLSMHDDPAFRKVEGVILPEQIKK